MILGRDQILQAVDIVKELVHCDEWGGDVYVRGLTGKERDAFESSLVTINGKDRKVNTHNIRAKLCALSICDESGQRLFTDQDVDALSKKSAAALDRCFSVAQRLSGLTETDVEELAKNSGSDQSDVSPTA